MGFIQIILFIVIAVILAGLLLAVAVIRSIYKLTGRAFGKKPGASSSSRSGQSTYQNQESGYTADNHTTSSTQSRNKKKVFDDDEGEYIEFEEIKEA